MSRDFGPETGPTQNILNILRHAQVLSAVDPKGLKEEKKLKIFDAIIEGKTKGKHKGNVYEINKTIIDLHQPLLTDEAKEEVLNLVNLPLNPEGRNHKNVLKMMNIIFLSWFIMDSLKIQM